jgi:hypothetical protein
MHHSTQRTSTFASWSNDGVLGLRVEVSRETITRRRKGQALNHVLDNEKNVKDLLL